MNIANHSELLVNRTFDELSIGETASLVRLVRAEDVKLFAAESGDVNPAHLDPHYAATDIFGHIVIHGMWTAGLISTLLGTQLPGPGTIYLDQSLHFPRTGCSRRHCHRKCDGAGETFRKTCRSVRHALH